MTPNNNRHTPSGFTLVELLIVLGIISVLSVSAVLVLNPAELLRASRDAARLNDAQVISKALALYEFASVSTGADWDGPNYSNSCKGDIDQKIFVSPPDSETPPAPPSGWTYAQAPDTSLKSVDGSGWLPVDLTNTGDSSLQALNTLPTDPINTFASGYYYSYICGSYEINLRLESAKYLTMLTEDKGDDTNVYEIGSNLFGSPVQVFAGGGDTTAPVLSNGSPSGSLSSGTTQTSIALTTDENATCKYGTTSGTSYASLPNTFSTTGGTSHSANVTGLSDGGAYSYYVRCIDGVGNQNGSDFTISFSVANGGVTDPTQLLPLGFSDVVFREFNSTAISAGDRGAGSFPLKTGGSEGWDDIERNYPNFNPTVADGLSVNYTTVTGLQAPPWSSPNIADTRFPAGFGSGSGPVTVQTQGFNTVVHGSKSYKQLAILMTIAFDNNFQPGPSGLNKLIWPYLQNGGGGNPFLGVRDFGSFKEFRFNLQGTPDNGRGFLVNNDPVNAAKAVIVTDNRWYSVLMVIGINLNDTVADGTFDMWVADHSIDGVFYKTTSYSDIDWRYDNLASFWTSVKWNPTWGGAAGTTNSVEFHYYLDRIRVWGKE